MYRFKRIAVLALAAVAAAIPAHAQRREATGPADRCESTTCFNQLQIRDVEIVTDTSLIVFVGSQRCPFLVEMTGLFCDMTFMPPYRVVFRPAQMASARTAPIVGGIGTAPDGGGPIEQTRVCATDLNMGFLADSFNSAVGGQDGDIGGLSCRIKDVRSMTDDERMQVYVDNDMAAPPPPFGTGRVATPDNPKEPDASPAEERESRRRNRDEDDRSTRRRRAADEEGEE